MTKPSTVSKNKQLDEKLLRMVVKEYQPFSLVEDAEFTRFVHMLCPAYLPTRKTLSNNILQNCFIETMNKVRESVKMGPAVYLIIESWTSLNNESFFTVTAHFLDSTTELRTFLLDCSKMDSSHTSQELSNQIKRISHEWEIDNKIVAIVTDKVSNIVGGVHDSGFISLTCFAYSLNLVKDFRENVEPENDYAAAISEVDAYLKDKYLAPQEDSLKYWAKKKKKLTSGIVVNNIERDTTSTSCEGDTRNTISCHICSKPHLTTDCWYYPRENQSRNPRPW
ncbi:hypothetical protein AVEN_199374-1 [Araneus ventricosus]|uniref:DUF659 domain-containing protein n=1 Tax=Araneus ventricosus TaxID=182803 RepID=A0A4Y2R4B0_ARAVE|nr:hypothetical protein AVEN_199374-1 [Araneus ventricosus]